MKLNIFQCKNCETEDICNIKESFQDFAVRLHQVDAPPPCEPVAYCPHYRFCLGKFNKGANK